MEAHTNHLESAAVEVSEIFGFFMGFRKDFSTIDYTNNILLRGGLNLGQGKCSGHCCASMTVLSCAIVSWMHASLFVNVVFVLECDPQSTTPSRS
jgi:hypothetical protein